MLPDLARIACAVEARRDRGVADAMRARRDLGFVRERAHDVIDAVPLQPIEPFVGVMEIDEERTWRLAPMLEPDLKGSQRAGRKRAPLAFPSALSQNR
jgi:hypothetical protein